MRIGIVIRTHEDRHFAVTPCTSGHAVVDHPRDLVGFLGAALEVQVHRADATPLNRLQPLANSGCHLKPVWIVVNDQPIGRVEQRLGRSVIVRQDYLSCVGVDIHEAEDVGDRCAPKLVD